MENDLKGQFQRHEAVCDERWKTVFNKIDEFDKRTSRRLEEFDRRSGERYEEHKREFGTYRKVALGALATIVMFLLGLLANGGG